MFNKALVFNSEKLMEGLNNTKHWRLMAFTAGGLLAAGVILAGQSAILYERESWIKDVNDVAEDITE